jgi:polysaccharide pyruvyl transferase CsaB
MRRLDSTVRERATVVVKAPTRVTAGVGRALALSRPADTLIAMRVAVAGWIGSSNLGDELIFTAITRKLASRGVEVVAVSIDTAATGGDHGVAAVRSASLPFAPIDRLVFGGGEVLQDETSVWNLPYHLSRVWSGRLQRVPFAVLGVGAVALRSRLGMAMVRSSLATARVVTVRDRPSLNALRRLGLSPVLAADPVLSLLVDARDPDRLVVCLRPPVGRSGRLGRLLPVGSGPSAPDPEWIASMAAALDRTATALGLITRFVAMQRGRDDLVHQQVAERMETPSEQAVPNLSDVLSEIARGQVVVAMRYHGGIAALVAGRPAVLVGYSPKVAALAEDAAPAALLIGNHPGAFGELPRFSRVALEHRHQVSRVTDRLRERESANDQAVDRLLEPAAR